ncbi:MAG: arsenite methyltransferase [Mycobacterium sp.]|jgi:SAM-dependent methyltransferase|nr:arsenite methyltransferase [Mycobacterium sp.]
MTETDTTAPPALHRVLELFADPPAEPDTSNGYLDLLAADSAEVDVPKNTGWIQAAWASPIGSMLYDNAQALNRRLFSAWRHPIEWLAIPPGGVALDVGCGPGNVTASLADAAGPDGLALGVDISVPMLTRAVQAQSGPNTVFVRADAQRLPFRDQTVDTVVSIAALQLIPDPAAALAEMGRVLRPGGRLAVMVPTAGQASQFFRLLPDVGAHMFGVDELGDILEQHGFVSVRTTSFGPIQWARAKHA